MDIKWINFSTNLYYSSLWIEMFNCIIILVFEFIDWSKPSTLKDFSIFISTETQKTYFYDVKYIADINNKEEETFQELAIKTIWTYLNIFPKNKPPKRLKHKKII